MCRADLCSGQICSHIIYLQAHNCGRNIFNEPAMPKSVTEILKRLPKARRKRIEAETSREAAQIMSLRDVRKAFHRSQEFVARALDMEQESVSRIERRADLLLSTMRKYVEAMGGDLKLIAKFPNRPPIQIETLATLADREEPKSPPRRKRA